jgi:alginate O-acetyltransferase complex protein AlgI
MPRPVANLITFTIVVVGWTIFRAHSMDQAFAFLRAMMQPGLPSQTAGVLINPDVTAAGVLAAVICALPRMPGFYRLRHFVFTTPAWTLTMQTALSLVFVLAVGKAVADPFKPFLYFRF